MEPFRDQLEPGQNSELIITSYLCAVMGNFFTGDRVEIALRRVKDVRFLS